MNNSITTEEMLTIVEYKKLNAKVDKPGKAIKKELINDYINRNNVLNEETVDMLINYDPQTNAWIHMIAGYFHGHDIVYMSMIDLIDMYDATRTYHIEKIVSKVWNTVNMYTPANSNIDLNLVIKLSYDLAEIEHLSINQISFILKNSMLLNVEVSEIMKTYQIKPEHNNVFDYNFPLINVKKEITSYFKLKKGHFSGNQYYSSVLAFSLNKSILDRYKKSKYGYDVTVCKSNEQLCRQALSDFNIIDIIKSK